MLSLRKVRRVRNLYVKYFSIGREQLGVSESFDEATVHGFTMGAKRCLESFNSSHKYIYIYEKLGRNHP